MQTTMARNLKAETVQNKASTPPESKQELRNISTAPTMKKNETKSTKKTKTNKPEKNLRLMFLSPRVWASEICLPS
jgi:hypothetical protein